MYALFGWLVGLESGVKGFFILCIWMDWIGWMCVYVMYVYLHLSNKTHEKKKKSNHNFRNQVHRNSLQIQIQI